MLLFPLVLLAAFARSELLNLYVKRAVIVGFGEVREELSVKFRNLGPSPEQEYRLPVASNVFQESVKVSTSSQQQLSFHFDIGTSMALVHLNEPINPGEDCMINVQLALRSDMTAHPSHGTLDGPSSFVVTSNSYFHSPYNTRKQKTYLKSVNGLQLTNFACEEPLDKGEKLCGTYEDVPMGKASPLKIYFTNKQFLPLKLTGLQSTFKLGGHGKIRVSETVVAQHVGSTLKDDDFSRAEMNDLYRRNGFKRPTAQFIQVEVPLRSSGFRVEDALGLNWSYRKRADAKRNVLIYDVQPRYPLASDWKYQFTYSYYTETSASKNNASRTIQLPLSSISQVSSLDSLSLTITAPEYSLLKAAGVKGLQQQGSRRRGLFLALGDQELHYLSRNPPSSLAAERIAITFHMPIWARLLRLALKAFAAMVLAYVLGYYSRSDARFELLSHLLEERKLLAFNCHDLAKIDQRIIEFASKNYPLRVADIEMLLRKDFDGLGIDSASEEILNAIEDR